MREKLVTLPQPDKFAPVNRCIYCMATDVELSDEHVIPFGLNGNFVLPDASCAKCADVTKQFEQSCLREIFGPTRARMGMRTRRKHERPNTFVYNARHAGRPVAISVPIDKLPSCVVGFDFPPPGIAHGPGERIWAARTLLKCWQDDNWKALMSRRNHRIVLAKGDMQQFGRMLAKIAHAYLVAKIGLERFTPLLLPLIFGADVHFSYWVGGDPRKKEWGNLINDRSLHILEEELCLIREIRYWCVHISLFAFAALPPYFVVVGEDRLNQPSSPQDGTHN